MILAASVGGERIPVRVSGRLNGGLPFAVTIRPGARITPAEAQKHLETIAARFESAPYYHLIRDKQVTVCFTTRSEFEQLGYFFDRCLPDIFRAPEENGRLYPTGLYEPRSETIYINTDDLARISSDWGLECLTHEFLHAYSSTVTSVGEGERLFKIGIWSFVERANERLEVSPQSYRQNGFGLNEGITELLRVRAGGKRPIGVYGKLLEAIDCVAGRIGEKNIFHSYFNHDQEGLAARVNLAYGGNDAFVILASLANTLTSGEGYQPVMERHLLGFARWGYEFEIMERWGYTAEEPNRAPRRVESAELPADSLIAQAIRGREDKATIYTNLTAGEWNDFFRYFPQRERHLNLGTVTIDDLLQAVQWHLNQPTRFILELIKGKLLSVPLAELAVQRFEPSMLEPPLFLGRSAEQTVRLTNVILSPQLDQALSVIM